MAKELLVEVWSDVVCPWCYIGKRRFEKALEGFAHRDQVRVVWRAFELDPSAPAERDPAQSQAERLARKYGTTTAQAQAMVDRVVQAAAQEGVQFDIDRAHPGNTFLLHRLLHLAHARGLQDAVKERFFRGYFCEGAAVGKPEAAAALAIDAGLDADEVQGVLASDLYTEDVRSDQREARELGITGVPFFLLARRYAVSGAQPAELLQRALQQTWDELPESVVGLADGALCGPDECAT